MADDAIDPSVGGDNSDLFQGMDRIAVRTRGLEVGANNFARAMTQAFSRAATDGKRFEDVLKSLALRLSNMALAAAFKPLTKSLASGLGNLFGNLFGSGSLATGDEKLLAAMGDAQPFAAGGVVATPTYFPLGRGQLGVAGEAGPEAILPLMRGADGKLGVAASGGGMAANVTIHINTPDAGSFRRSETYLTGLIARAVARGQRSL
jgi:phage-related minor tail protein